MWLKFGPFLDCETFINALSEATLMQRPHGRSSYQKGSQKDLLQIDKHEAQAFDSLIQTILSKPILARLHSYLSFIIETDASVYGVVVALFQVNPIEDQKPIQIQSRSLNLCEKNYSVPEKECFAFARNVKNMLSYIQSTFFTVCSGQALFR